MKIYKHGMFGMKQDSDIVLTCDDGDFSEIEGDRFVSLNDHCAALKVKSDNYHQLSNAFREKVDELEELYQLKVNKHMEAAVIEMLGKRMEDYFKNKTLTSADN